jgi:hypothetical protein
MKFLLTEAPGFYHRSLTRTEWKSVRWKSVLKKVIFVAVLMGAGAVAGFLMLGFAMQNEPNLTAFAVSILSPGLKVAEYFTPVTRQSLGSTFGVFLRVAIATNAVFYFIILTALVTFARLVIRRKNR